MEMSFSDLTLEKKICYTVYDCVTKKKKLKIYIFQYWCIKIIITIKINYFLNVEWHPRNRIKNLGVPFESKFFAHFEHVTSNILSTLGFIIRNSRPFTNVEVVLESFIFYFCLI
jgi:hypothetical protein